MKMLHTRLFLNNDKKVEELRRQRPQQENTSKISSSQLQLDGRQQRDGQSFHSPPVR